MFFFFYCRLTMCRIGLVAMPRDRNEAYSPSTFASRAIDYACVERHGVDNKLKSNRKLKFKWNYLMVKVLICGQPLTNESNQSSLFNDLNILRFIDIGTRIDRIKWYSQANSQAYPKCEIDRQIARFWARQERERERTLSKKRISSRVAT